MSNVTLPAAKVQNMQSSNGNDVPNQFEIFTEAGKYFQSYSSVIVFKSKDGKVILDEKYYNYSKTTSKYRNAFLRETTKEIEAKIKAGTYTLGNLNA